ncbi:MAG: hypothetical protein U5L76_05455 [Patescibacteria group bacterium]|nr:hypothetical protein [Patescibacteria group bacterium]
MKKILLFLFTLLLLPKMSLAGPIPQQYIINSDTKQCAEFFAGDECVIYEVPEDWQIIGELGEVKCPAGYNKINLKLKGKPVWRMFCLWPGYSGSNYTFYYFWSRVIMAAVILGLILMILIIIKKRNKKK